jgi:hypothetical protein
MPARIEQRGGRLRLAALAGCVLGLAGCVGPGLEPPGEGGGSKTGGFGDMNSGASAGSGGTAGTSASAAGTGAGFGMAGNSSTAGTGSSGVSDAGAAELSDDAGTLDDAALGDAGDMP